MTVFEALKSKIKHYEDTIETLEKLREDSPYYEERSAIYVEISRLYQKIFLCFEILNELVKEGEY